MSKGKRIPRIRLKNWDEYNLLVKFRESHKALAKEAEDTGFDIGDVKHYWYKSKNFSVFLKSNPVSYEDVRDEVIKEMNKHSPDYKKIERKKQKDGHLLVIDPADIHFGKLAIAYETNDAYNMQIAKERVLGGVQGIIDKSIGYNIDKIALVIGNDMLHIDSPHRKTTSGTPQDTDGMWFEAFMNAKKTIVEVIESLIPIADLHIIYNPSNHDYMSGFFLADAIHSWFRLCPNITWDLSISHRKYFQYGKSLIGTTHGDGAKTDDLPLLMAQESGNSWVDTKHRYWYIHHWHHKSTKDMIGVTIESLRSPSGTDSWHHKSGFQHSPKAVDGFIHSKLHGQVARLSHLF